MTVTTDIAGYRFVDPSLLDAALTHRSYLHEHPDEDAEDFERLEYLGDAVVDLVVGEELYRRHPDAREGELTALRALLVSSSGLAGVGTALKLHEVARLGRGEDESGGRGRVGLAASLYEAFVGAVYLDGGFEKAKAIVLKTMSRELDATAGAPRKSPKTLLQEWAQGAGHPLPTYRTIESSGPDHRRDFVVEVEVAQRVARGSGQSKREAQEDAAAKLLTVVTA